MQIRSKSSYASNYNRALVRQSQAKFAANAQDVFSGNQQSTNTFAAQFLAATDTTSQFQDYVKRNVDKFSGNTLKAMLIATDLIDWYQEKQKQDIAAAAKSLADKIDGLQAAGGSLSPTGVDVTA